MGLDSGAPGEELYVGGRREHPASEANFVMDGRSLMAGDALSRASRETKEKALPSSCRERIAACQDHPACVREQAR